MARRSTFADHRAILFDIDGVLTVSWKPLPGAAEAVSLMRKAGWSLAFVTNTSSMSRRILGQQLADAGIEARIEEIFTAARAATLYLNEHYRGARCLLLNSGSLGEDLEGLNLANDDGGAEVVLTGGAGPEIGYDLLNRAFRSLLDGASLVAMHRNFSWTTTDGPQLDMGPLVLALETAASVEAKLIGKPAPEFYSSILDQLGVEPSGAVMIGDDIESDVLGAQAIGMHGVLVRTGKFRAEALERASGEPDDVIDSVAGLAELLDIGHG
ncbi:MAG TPA: TIGR01458 family HAD-type hydrolase [Acidimicrobiales bacterium]|nr:TIGR01458 family HAD-type hydrolase [Acidimicrobiales bacterium]